MSSESALWSQVNGKLRLFGRLQRLETSTGLGIPDLLYCLARPTRFKPKPITGMIELKYAHRFPAKPETPLYFEHLTLEQVIWAEDWERAGGLCFCLCQVGLAYFLLNPQMTREVHHRQWTEYQFYKKSLVYSAKGFPTGEILRCLTPE